MNYSLFIWEIFINILTIFAVVYLLNKQLTVKPTKIKYVYIGAIAITVIISLLNYVDLNLAINVATGLTIYCNRVIVSILVFIFSVLVFNGSISEKIMWSCIPMFIISLSDFISLPVTALIYRTDIASLSLYESSRYTITIIHIIVVVVICLLLAKSGKKKSKITIPVTFRYFLVAATFLGTMTVDVLLDNMFITQNSITTLNVGELLIGVTFLFIIITIFILVMKVGILTRENIEYALENQQRKLEADAFKQTEINVDEIREIKHDIIHHIDVMQGLLSQGDYKSLDEYFETMTGRYSEKSEIIIVNNPIINSLMYSKMITMRKYGITLNSQIYNIDQSPVDQFDMCSILGNLLDNAIEACQKLPAPNNRIINLTVRRRGDMFIISAENSFNGEYKSDDSGRFHSSKNGKGHGLGINHIYRIVESYMGHMLIEPENFIFKVTIFLPYSTQ